MTATLSDVQKLAGAAVEHSCTIFLCYLDGEI